MAILDVYRIEISDEEILEVAKMADSHGEVQRYTDDVTFNHYNMVQIGRDEFLRYIQKSEMYRQFETHDGGTDMFWKKKIDLAFDLFDRNKDGKLTR